MEDPLHTLLSACRRGDSAAQRSLYERYKSALFAICLRYARDRAEAQDFLQDAFLIVFRDIVQYRGEGSLEGWLKKVTLRSILQQLRRKHPLRFAQDYDALPADPARVCMPD
ncbi:MAG TPA: sigma-70 family RNA polymerase sigma factor, partial [Saprospiraceae bacterium]|nr:sigma-70 family RNA polymerase sigma factor [Saprospiraceae bacterium]